MPESIELNLHIQRKLISGTCVCFHASVSMSLLPCVYFHASASMRLLPSLCLPPLCLPPLPPRICFNVAAFIHRPPSNNFWYDSLHPITHYAFESTFCNTYAQLHNIYALVSLLTPIASSLGLYFGPYDIRQYFLYRPYGFTNSVTRPCAPVTVHRSTSSWRPLLKWRTSFPAISCWTSR